MQADPPRKLSTCRARALVGRDPANFWVLAEQDLLSTPYSCPIPALSLLTSPDLRRVFSASVQFLVYFWCTSGALLCTLPDPPPCD